MKKHLITGIVNDSIARELDLKKGDMLLKVNDKAVIDVFDYGYETNNQNVTLTIESRGVITVYDIEKDEDEDIGLIFETELMDNPRACANNCVFCFVDQLPDDMRETLYFKDDDIRLSFLFGNYVTLTNTGDKELERIIKYKLSPINISVHATDPELRIKITGNKNAGRILPQIRKLVENNIEVNLQFVIVPGLNDDDALKSSLNDLLDIGRINSISVVPVGLTLHRMQSGHINPVDDGCALTLIEIVDEYRALFFDKYSKHTIYAADELYAKLSLPFPVDDYYEDYPQLENGVGMARIFIDEFEHNKKSYEKLKIKGMISIVTGSSFYPYMKELISSLGADDKIIVLCIDNKCFGESVTVSGLLTYEDISTALNNEKAASDTVILPDNMFRKEDMLTLDGHLIDDFTRSLKKVFVTAGSAAELIEIIYAAQGDES